MTTLPIHITTHHLSLSDSLRLFARKKIAPITRFANDALGAEIVLRRHGGAATRFSASARIALQAVIFTATPFIVIFTLR